MNNKQQKSKQEHNGEIIQSAAFFLTCLVCSHLTNSDPTAFWTYLLLYACEIDIFISIIVWYQSEGEVILFALLKSYFKGFEGIRIATRCKLICVSQIVQIM